MTEEEIPEELEWLTRPEAWDVQAREDGLLAFPDGSLWADPQGLPRHLRQRFGERVSIMGFWCHENPCSRLLGQVTERHDFAVLDGSWILDSWIPGVHGLDTRSVIHISEIEEKDNCHPLYGDPGRWEESLWLYPEFEADGLLWKNSPLPGEGEYGIVDVIPCLGDIDDGLTDVSANL